MLWTQTTLWLCVCCSRNSGNSSAQHFSGGATQILSVWYACKLHRAANLSLWARETALKHRKTARAHTHTLTGKNILPRPRARKTATEELAMIIITWHTRARHGENSAKRLACVLAFYEWLGMGSLVIWWRNSHRGKLLSSVEFYFSTFDQIK